MLFTISRALTVGRRAALLTVAGNTAGVGGQVVAVAFGMGVLVERSALLFTTAKCVGAGYLVYLGAQAIRHRRSMTEAVARRIAPVAPLRAVRDGIVVGFTNPKTIAEIVGSVLGDTT